LRMKLRDRGQIFGNERANVHDQLTAAGSRASGGRR
jgi:hypothetical protein